MYYDSRNSQAVASLDTVVKERAVLFLETLEDQGENVLITDAKRTAAQQHALFLKRPKVTNADYDESYHVWGLAIDFVPVDPNGKTRYDAYPRYVKCAEVAEKIGFEWGGRWKGPDKPHLQYTQGLTIQQLRAGKRLTPVKQEDPMPPLDLNKELAKAENALKFAKPDRKRMLERKIARLKKLLSI